MAEVQAMAVDLLDRLDPILGQAVQNPRPAVWSELARAAKRLQEFYELSFVQLAAHPEPGRSEQMANEVGAIIDHVAHREESHAGEIWLLRFEEKVVCAEHAFTTAGHMLLCLGAIGQSMPDGGTPEGSQGITEENADQVLRRNLEYVERVYNVLTTATIGMLS